MSIDCVLMIDCVVWLLSHVVSAFDYDTVCMCVLWWFMTDCFDVIESLFVVECLLWSDMSVLLIVWLCVVYYALLNYLVLYCCGMFALWWVTVKWVVYLIQIPKFNKCFISFWILVCVCELVLRHNESVW